MITFSKFLNEEVNFRLGGKDNKGNLTKTFGELEKGDKIYSTRVFHEDGRIKRQTHTFSSFEKDKLGHNYIHYESFINSSFSFDSPQIFDSSATCALGDKFNWILSTYEMTDEDARRIVKKREEAREEQIYEGVDFRLGGKANKGDNIKTFDDLEEGDTAYLYRVRSDMEYFSLFKEIKIDGLQESHDGGLGLKSGGYVVYITIPEKHRSDTTYIYKYTESNFKDFYVLTTYKIGSLDDLDRKIDINKIEIY